MKKTTLFLLLVSVFANAQKNVTYSAYVETYYNYNFAKPANHLNADFLYNFKRHNELNLNLAYVKANYNKENTRGNLAFMVGNYAQYNLASEPTWAQFIFEGNIGFKISKKKNIWIDAGIMPSHIGFETAVGADNWTLTRSILAENSPYYESGVKISYVSKNEKLNGSFSLLNGWQNLQRQNNNQIPSIGIQLNYKANSNLTLNYSNFVGNVNADSLHQFRTFHNFYAIYEPKKKINFIFGFDLGTQKINSNKTAIWYSPVIIGRYKVNDKNKIAIRAEHYNDAKQIIIKTGIPKGFKVFSFSANYDRTINSNMLWRIEARHFLSKDKIFADYHHHNNNSITTSLTLKL